MNGLAFISWLLSPIGHSRIPGILDIPCTSIPIGAEHRIVRCFARPAVVVFKEAAVALILVPPQAFDHTKLGKRCSHLVIIELTLSTLEENKECSLVLVAVTTLRHVLLSWQAVVHIQPPAVELVVLH